MILYSVTVEIDPALEHEWVVYMKAEHIPAVLGTGCFTGHEFLRVTDPPSSSGWARYCTHYRLRDRAEYERYLRDFAPAMRGEVIERFGERFRATREVLESVENVRL